MHEMHSYLIYNHTPNFSAVCPAVPEIREKRFARAHVYTFLRSNSAEVHVIQQWYRRFRQYGTVHGSLETVQLRRRGEAPFRHSTITFSGSVFKFRHNRSLRRSSHNFANTKNNLGCFHTIWAVPKMVRESI